MTTRENKERIKITTTITATLVIALILFSPTTVMPNINAQQSSSDCVKTEQQQMYSTQKELDDAKAISMATSNSQFQSKIHGVDSKFNSIFNTWTLDTNCNVKWDTVNVVYTITGLDGNIKNVVVTEDPGLTKTLNVTEQTTEWNTPTFNWSGYEFYMNGMSGKDVLYEAKNSFTEPTVSKPFTASTGNCSSPVDCQLSIWAGLEDTPGATNKHLAQDGATGEVACGPTGVCSPSYNMWYEFLPAGVVKCTGTGTTITHGDSITADVVNEKKTGGSNSLYDMSVTDSSQGTACSTSAFSYTSMTAPIYSDFLAERPCYSGCGGGSPTDFTLPQFTTFSETGTIYDGTLSSSKSISVPAGNSWDLVSTMDNGIWTNINLGSAGTGSFTETWNTSSGT